jgi:branched-subunit amino acid ABC-type transport system permease component
VRTVNDFLTFLPSGISAGSIYTLIALGLVLTYKTSGVFNFSHGAIAATSAYMFYEFWVKQGWSWQMAFLASVLIVGVGGGLLMERLAALLSSAPTVMVVVATVGVLVFLQSLMTAIYGPANIFLQPYLSRKPLFNLGVFGVTREDLTIVLFSLGSAAALYFFFERTRLGKATTAVVDDPNLLSLQKTNPSAVRRLSWVVGSCFAAISGVFLAPSLGVSVNTLILLVIAAYGAAAVGRFESLPLTVAGAMGIGIMVSYLPSQVTKLSSSVLVQNLPSNSPFMVLFVVFLVVPARYLTERGVRNARRLKPIRTYSPTVTRAGFGVLLVVLAFIPMLTPETDVSQYASTLGYFIVFASLGMLVWMSGQISLCQMSFAAIGAATAGHMLEHHVPFLLALVIAGLVAIPAGALVSIPAIRLAGIYVAIATFGFAIVMQQIGYLTPIMFGQDQRIEVPRPHILGMDATTGRGYYYLCLFVAVFAAVVVLVVRGSRLGSLLRAMSDSPVALDAHGANTNVMRIVVFCIASFMAGVGGVMIAGVPGNASGALTGPFNITISLVMVAVLGFAGRRPISSPLIAAVLFQLIKIYPPFNTQGFIKYQGVLFGLAAVTVAIWPALEMKERLARLGRFGCDRDEGGPVAGRLQDVPVAPVRIRAAAVKESVLAGAGTGADR